MNSLAAIILSGGNARRLGGADKCWLEIGGTPILAAVVNGVAALAEAESPTGVGAAGPASPSRVHIVVVGATGELATPVLWAREDPPGSGPVAAIAAGMQRLTDEGLVAGDDDRVLLLAGDMPFAPEGLAQVLSPGIAEADVALGRDPSGRDQYLLAVWRARSLRRALVGARATDSIRSLYRDAMIDRRTLDERASLDCDTPEDLELARELAVRNPTRP